MKKFKIAVLLILYFAQSVFLFTQEDNAWFPQEAFLHSVALSEYIASIISSDQNIIRNEYLIIIDFIKKTIVAYQENIERLFAGISFVWTPSLIDGKLLLVEIELDTIEMWDIDLQESRLMPDPLAHLYDLRHLHYALFLYNELINFWYNKTGEMLSEHIDYDVISNRVLEFIRNENTQ